MAPKHKSGMAGSAQPLVHCVQQMIDKPSYTLFNLNPCLQEPGSVQASRYDRCVTSAAKQKWMENPHTVPWPDSMVMCSTACGGPCQHTVYGLKCSTGAHVLLQARRSCTPRRQRHRLHTASGIFSLQTLSSHPAKHDLLIQSANLQQPAHALCKVLHQTWILCIPYGMLHSQTTLSTFSEVVIC